MGVANGVPGPEPLRCVPGGQPAEAVDHHAGHGLCHPAQPRTGG